MKKTFYLTTPIYYPSGKLHIGHSYTTVAADAMCRYKRLKGFDVMFLTGTDEHGQKIQMKAAGAGVSPQEYVDRIVSGIKDLWKTLNIRYDRFIRTTDADHEKAIQAIFQKLYDKGDIYKSEYEGWYCTPCESFWTQTQAKDGNCPDCGRPVVRTKEESYFFRISKYQDALIRLFENNPDFIEPSSRANEMLSNFLRPGLEDLCVSRTSFDWGVKVPFDPKHVVYVWIDALSNYITALGYPDDPNGDFRKYWPADVHLVGKEIVRFHTIIWPAMLMALDLPLPKKVFGHGWLLLEGGKISKSKENKSANIIDPVILCERYGVDAIRYFLLREVQFGADGQFSNESLIGRINSDLANDLGNLVSRTAAMIEKYFGAWIPEVRETSPDDEELEALCGAVRGRVDESMEKLQFSTALAEIWKVIGRCNKYIDETAPWVLAKDEGRKARLASVLFHLAEAIRIIAILIEPFMPDTSAAIKVNFGISAPEITAWDSAGTFGLYYSDSGVRRSPAIFPRIDVAAELLALQGLNAAKEDAKPAAAPEQGKTPSVAAPVKTKDVSGTSGASEALPAAAAVPAEAEGISLIEFTDFLKVSLKTGKILECRKVEGSSKLLMSQVDIGGEVRQILSGIALYYSPEEMVGKTVIVVTNLKPRKMMGKESAGMLLCAQEGDRLKLLTVEGDIGAGAEVS